MKNPRQHPEQRPQRPASRYAPELTTPAAKLIAAARAKVAALPSAEGIEALRQLCTHNDSISRSGPGRVSADEAITMLRSHYSWSSNSRTALNTVCRKALGRRSYGTP